MYTFSVSEKNNCICFKSNNKNIYVSQSIFSQLFIKNIVYDQVKLKTIPGSKENMKKKKKKSKTNHFFLSKALSHSCAVFLQTYVRASCIKNIVYFNMSKNVTKEANAIKTNFEPGTFFFK